MALRVISLGAGVQSTCMALMGAEGAFGPPPDAAIFADTGWEPPHIYEHLDWLTEQLPYPVYRVGNPRGGLKEFVAAHRHEGGTPGVDIPLYIRNEHGRAGMTPRQCTQHYKIEPQQRQIRELLGVGPRGHVGAGAVELWLGISTDEAIRVKPSPVRYIVNRYPLIEARHTRASCMAWFEQRYPERTLRKSACMGCPYQSMVRWVALKREYPHAFEESVAIDYGLRARADTPYKGEAYLLRSLVPLDVGVAGAEAQGQLLDVDGFGNECEGYCGV